jgi:hypothetical protein
VTFPPRNSAAPLPISLLLGRTKKYRKIKNLQQRRRRSAATDRTDCDSRKKAVECEGRRLLAY